MPNHVTHRVVAKGPYYQIEWLLAHFSKGTLDFQTIIPMPGALHGTLRGTSKDEYLRNKIALEETGYSDWYEWSIKNWGTKWNAYDGRIERAPDELLSEGIYFPSDRREIMEIEFVFQTAWSVPEPIFEKLAKLHPDVEFSLKSFDEGSCFAVDQVFKGSFALQAVEPSDTLYEQVYGRPRERDGES